MNKALFLFLILLLGLVLCSFLGGNCNREGMVVTNTDTVQDKLENAYDNYNHYNNTVTDSIYYGPNGGMAKVITNPDGTHGLQVTLANGSSPVLFSSQPTNASSSATQETFYGPHGATATITNTQQGHVIQVNTNNGTLTFAQRDSSLSSTQYYGSTGNQQDPTSNTNPTNNMTATSSTSTDYYPPNPADYSSSLPPGIPKRLIPAGEEDLYILKSQVVPPVCPACPVSSACPREKPCPACPPCARCPEPSMKCKMVPNYDSMGNTSNNMGFDDNMNPIGGYNNQFLPVPVLNDFSTFGT